MVLNNKIQKYLDIPQIFNFIRHIIDRGQTEQLKKIIKKYNFKSILDVGCGTGDFCDITDNPYVGVDNTKSFIDYATKKFGSNRKKFYTMDATKMSFKDKQFDAALLAGFIHHLPDDKVISILKDVARTTKRFVIVWDNIPTPRNIIRKIFYAMDRGANIRPLEKQIELIKKTKKLDIVKVDSWRSSPGIYLHSIIICKPKKN